MFIPPTFGGKHQSGGGGNPPQEKKWGESFLPTGEFFKPWLLYGRNIYKKSDSFSFMNHLFCTHFQKISPAAQSSHSFSL